MNKIKDFLYGIIREIYHTFFWWYDEVKSFVKTCRKFSFKYAAICFKYDYSARYISDKNKKQKYFDLKYNCILEVLTEQLKPVIQTQSNKNTERRHENTVWMFWLSGIETAPEIVRVCVKSIQKAAGNIKVELLDGSNYREFIEIPEDICKMHDEGKIGHAHFSDILRLSLLAKYGGLWVDATIFCPNNIPDDAISNRFYSVKMQEPNTLSTSKSMWAGWLLGGDSDFPLFSFARDALIQYWRSNDYLIDYLLMDYVFYIAYMSFTEVKQTIDNMQPNNMARNELMNNINKAYDKAFFEENNTSFYKMSYRFGKPVKTDKQGNKTFYGYITDQLSTE